jgi:hypothetical protein
MVFQSIGLLPQARLLGNRRPASAHRIPILMRDHWQVAEVDRVSYSVEAHSGTVDCCSPITARLRPRICSRGSPLWYAASWVVEDTPPCSPSGQTLLLKAGECARRSTSRDRGLAFADSMHASEEGWRLACCRVRALVATRQLAPAESAMVDARRRLPSRALPSDFLTARPRRWRRRSHLAPGAGESAAHRP